MLYLKYKSFISLHLEIRISHMKQLTVARFSKISILSNIFLQGQCK